MITPPNILADYSVLMSVYSKDNHMYLEESIQSILNQTHQTNDFVIVCDGPLTEDLNTILNKYESMNSLIKIIRLNDNIGLGRALNYALPYCKNDMVARMDSDDISLPNRAAEQVKIFMNDQSLSIVSATIVEYDLEHENIESFKELPENHEEIIKYSKKRNPFNHPVTMFKKSAVIKIGGYQDFYLYEDYHLWIRLLEEGYRGYNIKEPLLHMRAGIELTNRRGGYKYFKSTKRFQKFLLSLKYISYPTYIFNIITRFTIQVLTPKKVRYYIYKKLLRWPYSEKNSNVSFNS